MNDSNLKTKEYLNNSDSSSEAQKKSKHARGSAATVKRGFGTSKNCKSHGFENTNFLNKQRSGSSTKSSKVNHSMIVKAKSPQHSSTYQEKTIQCSPTRRQLEEDYRMKVKVNSLQRSIDSQAKVLETMQRKLASEKSDIFKLQDKFDHKDKREQIRAERLISGFSEDDEKLFKRVRLGGKKRVVSFHQDEKENRLENLDRKDFNLRHISENFSERALKEQINKILEEELERKGEENIYQKRKIQELKKCLKNLTRKYELQIDELQREMSNLNEENFRYKYKSTSQGNNDKLEELYTKRITDLEALVSQKEKEIAEKDESYENNICNMNSKIESLKKETERISDYQDQIKDHREQLQLKNREIETLKKYYSEKLQAKTDNFIDQKKEWSKTYTKLINEIRNLKGEVDILGYEKDKLFATNSISNGSNVSTLRTKDSQEYRLFKKGTSFI